jgi:sortase (surface protein transpeptidase)
VQYVYEVTSTEEVDARAMEAVDSSFGRKLTLITCANWDNEARTYTHRFVVTARFLRAEAVSS